MLIESRQTELLGVLYDAKEKRTPYVGATFIFSFVHLSVGGLVSATKFIVGFS
jgi:hypothetical protein